jgi:hypothetical protein
MSTASALAQDLAAAVAARDFAGAGALVHPEVDFRGMTPNRIWEGEGPAGVEDALRMWLDNDERDVSGVEALAGDTLEDTARVAWRVRGTRAEGPFVFEQQAYVRERDGQIGWLRVMCTGPRPLG